VPGMLKYLKDHALQLNCYSYLSIEHQINTKSNGLYTVMKQKKVQFSWQPYTLYNHKFSSQAITICNLYTSIYHSHRQPLYTHGKTSFRIERKKDRLFSQHSVNKIALFPTQGPHASYPHSYCVQMPLFKNNFFSWDSRTLS
jgi:hypothetical protein